MIRRVTRTASTWWSSAVAGLTETMDEIDAVWEPFLFEDERPTPGLPPVEWTPLRTRWRVEDGPRADAREVVAVG